MSGQKICLFVLRQSLGGACLHRCEPSIPELSTYDAVSDVGESGVQWRSNFQIGSRVLKIVINLLLCISMTYNVISCIEVAEITQTLKIADFTM